MLELEIVLLLRGVIASCVVFGEKIEWETFSWIAAKALSL